MSDGIGITTVPKEEEEVDKTQGEFGVKVFTGEEELVVLKPQGDPIWIEPKKAVFEKDPWTISIGEPEEEIEEEEEEEDPHIFIEPRVDPPEPIEPLHVVHDIPEPESEELFIIVPVKHEEKPAPPPAPKPTPPPKPAPKPFTIKPGGSDEPAKPAPPAPKPQGKTLVPGGQTGPSAIPQVLTA